MEKRYLCAHCGYVFETNEVKKHIGIKFQKINEKTICVGEYTSFLCEKCEEEYDQKIATLKDEQEENI